MGGLLLSLLGMGALGPRPLGAEVWTKFEELVGAAMSAELRHSTGEVDSPLLRAWVEDIGRRVTAESRRGRLTYRFAILDTYERNAYALPGGYIWVTRGLLRHLASDEELAGVLAHEVAHSDNRDFARYLKLQLVFLGAQALLRRTDHENWVAPCQALQVFESLRHSRRYEGDADRAGLEIAWRANFDPEGLLEFLGPLGAPEGWLEKLIATHPPGPERVRAAEQHLAKLRGSDYHRQLALAADCLARGQHARAARSYQVAARLWPDRAEPLVALAELQTRRGLVRAARVAYQEALGREPECEAAQRGLARLTREGQYVLRPVALEPVAADTVRRKVETLDAASQQHQPAVQALYATLRQHYTDQRLNEALRVSQVLAPELNETAYLAAFVTAHQALQRAQRVYMKLTEVYHQVSAVPGGTAGLGRELRQPRKVPDPSPANNELLAAAVTAYGDLAETVPASVGTALAQASGASRQLTTGARLVAAAFLALVGSGSGQPLGKLTYSRFLVLQSDILYGDRCLRQAEERAEAALTALVPADLQLSLLSLTVLQAQAGSSQQAHYRSLVERRLRLPPESLRPTDALGLKVAEWLALQAPAEDLEGLQGRGCLAARCLADLRAEEIVAEEF